MPCQLTLADGFSKQHTRWERDPSVGEGAKVTSASTTEKDLPGARAASASQKRCVAAARMRGGGVDGCDLLYGGGGGGALARCTQSMEAAHMPTRKRRGSGGRGWWRRRTCPVEVAEAPSPSTRSFCQPRTSSFSTELQPGPNGPNFSQPLDQIILLIFVEE
jgi:hypothetical protein